MKTVVAALTFATALGPTMGQADKAVGGFLFEMADCPEKCLAYDVLDQRIELQTCRTAGNYKVWELDYGCGDKGGFFQIRNVLQSQCIADPEDCSACGKDINLVDCDTDQAAWFSYGTLQKTSPKAYNLYSARCWLNEGLVSVLATPSLDSKTCPDDHSLGACQKLEWNLDHFSKDILYYEWSFDEVKSECSSDLFAPISPDLIDETPEYPDETVNGGSTTNDVDDGTETVGAAAYANRQPQGSNRNLTVGLSCAAAAMLVAGLVNKKRRVTTRTSSDDEIFDGVVEEDDASTEIRL